MSVKKQKEIIGLLEETIQKEKQKKNPNGEVLEVLESKLKKVIDYVPKA